jgi:TPR repeat protein
MKGRTMACALKAVVAAVALVLSFAAPATAGWFQESMSAYREGDYAAALRQWRPRADQGNALAQAGLAMLYAKGHGVTQDYAEAAKWTRLAAEQGFALAQYSLGIIYAKGQGVPKDYVEAMKWYRRAADQGHPNGQFNLALGYVRGDGVTRNLTLAHMWFNLAAARGVKDAEKGGRRLAQHMTPAQIAEAQKLAGAWKPKKER